jgi:predicted aconitase
VELSAGDKAMLDGERGEALRVAMGLLVAVGTAEGATEMIDIESAHIDGCLFHGVAGLDFAELLVDGGGEVAVPTTLNVSSLDLLHPDLYRGDRETAALSRRLMDAYVALGCSPTWTCAPYQLAQRPRRGAQIAWGESNAIVFANSVLGARTNRYGDFADICCALTGRAPHSGLHTDAGRRATLVVELRLVDDALDSDLTYVLIGHALGRLAGNRVSALVGLDSRASEDRLKALGAAAASSGSVAMFHAVGVTPEAPDLAAVVGEGPPPSNAIIDVSALEAAYRELNQPIGALGVVSVGTPHISLPELERLASLVTGERTSVPFYINIGRDTMSDAAERGIVEVVEAFGGTFVSDTCTYVTAIIGDVAGDIMTDSGKLAYYAPANLGMTVAIGTLEDCVRSAIAGRTIQTSPLPWK